MKHTIIKDFKGWNVLMENAGFIGEETTGSAGTSGTAGTGGRTGTSGNGVSTSGTAGTGGFTGTAGTGGFIREETVPAVPAVPAVPTEKLAAITAADGALQSEDLKKIQAVVYNVPLTDTKSCDGMIGPNTIAKIKEFRTANGITDETVEPTRTAIGPKTLAKIIEKITAGFIPGGPATPAVPVVSPNFDQRIAADDTTATQICQMIQDKFKEVAFWDDFKNNIFYGGDDEATAGAAYNNWYVTAIVPLTKALRPGDPNIAKIDTAQKTIVQKLQGGTANDTYSWQIDTLNGPMQYTVDTDF